MAAVIPNEGLMNLLNAALRGDDPVIVRLAKNAPTLSPATVLGDFTEADFSGYAAVTASPLSEPDVTPNGKVRTQSMELSFAHNGGPTGNTITVFYATLETGTGSKLLFADQVEGGPVVMSSVDDTIDLTFEIRETQEV